MKNVLPKPWKELFDKHWNTPIRKRAKERLAANLGRLVFYCQPAGPKAKDASDVDALVKQLTLWPGADLLKSIEDAVLVLAVTERKFPERRIWKTFELVNRRMPKLRLAGCRFSQSFYKGNA